MHILLVLLDPGDPYLARQAAASLRSAGHRVEVAIGREDGLWLATGSGFDALVIHAPAGDDQAARLCSALRKAGDWTPVLVLAYACESGCIAALDAGADTCETAPLRPGELEARLRALVRRGRPERPSVLVVGSIELDPGSRLVSVVGGQPLPVIGLPFDVLELLMRREGQVTTRQQIADHVWDWAWEARSNVIDVHVHHLRSVLGPVPDAPVIDTVRGIGFRLRAGWSSRETAGPPAGRIDSHALHEGAPTVASIGRVRASTIEHRS